jgi:prevent-host-death family protein
MKTMNVTDFKARCLRILQDVARTGEGITILNRGRPIAQVLPVVPRRAESPQATLRGTVEILGDIVEPALPADAWNAERRRK